MSYKDEKEHKKGLVNKILSQPRKMLEWQFSDDKSEVELLYWHEDQPEITDLFISAEVGLFNKEVSYVHSVYYNDGFQQDIRDTDINILDEDADFDIDDIIDCFLEVWHKDINKIHIGKIE